MSVSLDDDSTKWKEAIIKDGLTWTQVSNLIVMEENPIVKQYDVKLIPTTFLLDASGKIVGIDLPHDALEAKIEALLAAK